MRKSSLFLAGWAVLSLLFAAMVVHAAGRARAAEASVEEERRLVGRLGLTDLCLCTEASYTRHLSLSDLFTPFQDHPFALEHFPSGSWLQPPAGARLPNGRLVRTTKKHS